MSLKKLGDNRTKFVKKSKKKRCHKSKIQKEFYDNSVKAKKNKQYLHDDEFNQMQIGVIRIHMYHINSTQEKKSLKLTTIHKTLTLLVLRNSTYYNPVGIKDR